MHTMCFGEKAPQCTFKFPNFSHWATYKLQSSRTAIIHYFCVIYVYICLSWVREGLNACVLWGPNWKNFFSVQSSLDFYDQWRDISLHSSQTKRIASNDCNYENLELTVTKLGEKWTKSIKGIIKKCRHDNLLQSNLNYMLSPLRTFLYFHTCNLTHL